MLINSIKESPFQLKKEIIVPGVNGAPGEKSEQTVEDLSPKEKTRYDCDIKAVNILFIGLPADMYTIINHYQTAKEILDRVKELMKGTKITLQEQQVHWSPVSKLSLPENVTKPIPTQVFPKKLPTTNKAHANLQNAKDILDKFKACIKKRTVLSGVEVRNLGVMHIKGAFEQDITPFLKNLKEAYKHFEMGLYKEVHEMKGVLCGCYPELQKAKMACSTATFVKFRISYKYADLRRVWIFKFPPSNEIWEVIMMSESGGNTDKTNGRVLVEYGLLLHDAFLPAPVILVGSFWTALKALSRKEVHYGSNARTESMANDGSKGMDLRRSLRGSSTVGNVAAKNTPLRSCLASKLRNIDGKVVGKDGKPMKEGRCVQFDQPIRTSDNQSTDETNVNYDAHCDVHDDQITKPFGEAPSDINSDIGHVDPIGAFSQEGGANTNTIKSPIVCALR
ncbi:hypothetical protein Tco_0360352 [Tanacetum coccineum]